MGKTDHGFSPPVTCIAPSRTMKAIHGRGSFFQVSSGLIWTINKIFGNSLQCL